MNATSFIEHSNIFSMLINMNKKKKSIPQRTYFWMIRYSKTTCFPFEGFTTCKLTLLFPRLKTSLRFLDFLHWCSNLIFSFLFFVFPPISPHIFTIIPTTKNHLGWPSITTISSSNKQSLLILKKVATQSFSHNTKSLFSRIYTKWPDIFSHFLYKRQLPKNPLYTNN